MSAPKSLPKPSADAAPYWEGLKRGRLRLQRCGQCGKLRHYPRPLCDACHSFAVEWIEACGRGTVHSWTVTHHAFDPAFAAELPLTLVTVDLAEGLRIMAPLRGVDAAALAIGVPVRVVFEWSDAELSLPAIALDV